MKKFTILLATIATLFSASLFIACSEPESNEPTIVGTWVAEISYGDVTEKAILVFNENGSGSVTMKVTNGSTSYQEYVSFEYVYIAEKSTLRLIPDSYDSEFAEDLMFCTRIEVQITSNKLVMRMWHGEDEFEASAIFTREK